MLRAVTTQALNQTAVHEISVGLENHVDEVNDDDSTDVAQTKLTDDFFRRLNVVLGHGFFEVSTGSHEFAGVDVNDRHGLGAVNNQ